MRSTLAGVAETGSETAQRLEGCKKTIPHRLRRSSLYTKEPFKINRGSATPLLFDFLSYLFSQKNPPDRRVFVSFFSLSYGAYKLAVICVDDERVAHIEVV